MAKKKEKEEEASKKYLNRYKNNNLLLKLRPTYILQWIQAEIEDVNNSTKFQM